MEENDRKVRETYRKKIKGRTSLNMLTKPRRKKKSKERKTYRGFASSRNDNSSTNQTKAQQMDEKIIVPQEKDTLIRKLAHYINQLSSEERSIRIGAAKYVNRALLVGCKESKTRAEVWSECLMKPILKLVADPVECVREISLELIRGCATLPEVDFGASLPYLFPVLMDRIPEHYAYDEATNVFVADVKSHESHLRGRISENQIEKTKSSWSVVSCLTTARTKFKRLP